MKRAASAALTLLLGSGCYLTHTPAEPRRDAGPDEAIDAGFDAGIDAGLDGGLPDACVLDPERCELLPLLRGLRWELPCGDPVDEDDIVCETPVGVARQVRLPGEPGDRFVLTLRFRGVVELAEYVGEERRDGHFVVGGGHYGGAWNHYELAVSAPAQSYFLNAGPEGEYVCVAIDYVQTIEVAGGAVLRLFADSIDDASITNHDAELAPIVVEGVPPAPEPYDGQFIQMDVLEVERR